MMDKALRIFFKTGRDLEEIKSKAGKVRVSDIESLVQEFQTTLTKRAVAAEALEVHSSTEMKSMISELKGKFKR